MMVTMLAGLLFSFGLMMAAGTIVGMTLAYRGKAMAALRMEPRPDRPGPAPACYSPARRVRFVARLGSTGGLTPVSTIRAA